MKHLIQFIKTRIGQFGIIIKSSLVLLFFSVSLTIFNITCKKESVAQNTITIPVASTTKLGGVIVGSGLSVTSEGTISTQNLGIVVFSKGGDNANEFWTSKYDGSGQSKITISGLTATAEIEKGSLKISPDGKKFFFVASLTETSTDALYSCNSDGTGLFKIADNINEFSDAK